jgi:hypothetical protein
MKDNTVCGSHSGCYKEFCLLYKSTLEYAIRKVQKNQEGLKLNATRQLLANADDVNLLGDNIDTIKNRNINWC